MKTKTEQIAGVPLDEALRVLAVYQTTGEAPHKDYYEGFISNNSIWQSAMFRREPGEVTHWQPMPQPPKGE